MDNEIKLSDQQLKNLKNKLKESCDKKSAAEEFIKENLSESQAQTVKQLLENPEKVKRVLESPFARALMEKLLSEKGD